MGASPQTRHHEIEHPWAKNLFFHDISVKDLGPMLQAKLVENRFSRRKPAVILDLDSTLFDLSRRSKSIFFSFLRQYSRPERWHFRMFENFDKVVSSYSIRQIFLQAANGIFSDSSELVKKVNSLFFEFMPFWEAHFFSNRHMHYDDPYPGALNFIRELEAAGFSLIYLTGRDRIRCRVGTVASLNHHGFTVKNPHALWMKPTIEERDVAFKKRAAEVLEQQYNVIAAFDNEPENIVVFAQKFRNAEIIFFHSIMSSRVPENNIHSYLRGRKVNRLRSFALPS